MRRWLKPVDFKFPYNGDPALPIEEQEKTRLPINTITNETLLKWLEKYIPPDEWVIEITGGEPGLYPEIQTLVPALEKAGYYGVIKTNGSLPIPKAENFPLVAAWHKGIEAAPEYYDWLLILKNPNDNWRAKIAYCKERGIKYKALPFNYAYLTGENIGGLVTRNNSFLNYCAVMSMGQVIECPAAGYEEGRNIANMTPPRIKNLLTSCSLCGSVAGVEIFLPEEIMERVKEGYEAAKGR
jgi:hypothetical protein